MNNKIQNVVTAVSLSFIATAISGCDESHNISRIPGGGATVWNSPDESSIDGVDAALVQQFEYLLEDGGEASAILWTNCRPGGGIATTNSEQVGREFVHNGYVYWDEDEKVKCPFTIRLRNNGQHTAELVGTDFDLKDGATILVKNRGGKFAAKQIGGVDLDNANSETAHENQEIFGFYNDNQQSTPPENEPPKD